MVKHIDNKYKLELPLKQYKRLDISYDGDQITVKGVYTEEANQELEEFMNSKQNFITFGGKPSKASEGDAIQSIYAFTKVLSDTKLTQNIQFS